ncbi:hypothetical protein BIW11_02553 [Tropilaelaps mercedesae]|uniref:Degenerin del-1-like n=1 Tax=Tropilaelaps mercedesae TaxID=418985 RepID=A0A1V9Y172_9ACAR|nr:hypothetical protein BIW11_02553 [Tropilaelaps mercedesae]
MCRCVRRDIALPYEVDWDKEPSGKRRFCDQDITFTRCWVRVLDEVEKCINHFCKKECWEDQYEVSVTRDPWPDQFFFEEEKARFEELEISNFKEARMNLTRIKIIFGTLNKVTYRHRAKYEFHSSTSASSNIVEYGISDGFHTDQQIELFSYLGGFIGIWVGISFMNVLDYSTVGLNCLIRKIHERRKTRKNAVHEIPPETHDVKGAW